MSSNWIAPTATPNVNPLLTEINFDDNNFLMKTGQTFADNFAGEASGNIYIVTAGNYIFQNTQADDGVNLYINNVKMW